MISLALVLGAVGAAGFVWWRWEFRERRFDKLIMEIAPRYGVDPCLVKAVMRRESRFDPWVYGRHGEIGLMQVTEGAGQAWARAVGRRDYGRSLLWDARVNVEAGSWYLGRAMGRWPEGGEELRVALGLAEYNAGYGNVVRWLRASNAGRMEGVGGSGNAAGVGGAGGGVAGGGSVRGKELMGNAGVAGGGVGAGGGGGGGELTAKEFVGGVTWPGVRDYVTEVMESWRIYRERGYL